MEVLPLVVEDWVVVLVDLWKIRSSKVQWFVDPRKRDSRLEACRLSHVSHVLIF